MTFLLKRYTVSVSGFPDYGYDAATPGAARALAWGSYRTYRDVPFKDFLKISAVRRGVPPEGYGRPILVGGAPGFLISRDGHSVRFVRPGETTVVYSHPLDVSEAA